MSQRCEDQRAPRHPRPGRVRALSAYKAREVLDLIRGLHGRPRPLEDPASSPSGHRPRRSSRLPRVGRSPTPSTTTPSPADELFVLGLLRRRGPDAQALAPPCPGPRHPHPQAHLPHHHHREPATRRRPGPAVQAAAAAASGRAGHQPRRRRSRGQGAPAASAKAEPARRPRARATTIDDHDHEGRRRRGTIASRRDRRGAPPTTGRGTRRARSTPRARPLLAPAGDEPIAADPGRGGQADASADDERKDS